MKLEQQKQSMLDAILVCIEDGTTKSENMDAEYRVKRREAVFDQARDVTTWQAEYSTWFIQSEQMLKDNFRPAVILTNRFKNPPMSALYIDGENMEWNSLAKNYSARLELLGSIYETVASIRDDKLSDFLEITVGVPGVAGAKIKVDKLLSRIFK